jgi:fatty-acyl-CoA synthase
VVAPAPGVTIDAGAFRAWARQRLAGFKTPRYVAVVDALPRTTGTGKIQKAVLREQYRDLIGRSK